MSRNRRNDQIPWNNNCSRDFVVSPVSRHFPYLKDFVVLLFLDRGRGRLWEAVGGWGRLWEAVGGCGRPPTVELIISHEIIFIPYEIIYSVRNNLFQLWEAVPPTASLSLPYFILKVSRNSKTTKLNNDFSRDFVVSPVSRHFPYSRDFVFLLFLDTFNTKSV